MSTAAGGKDIRGISAGAVAVIGVTGVGAITCVAEADAAVADADPSVTVMPPFHGMECFFNKAPTDSL